MLVVISLCFLLIFVYVNTLFFSLSLLFVVVGLLYALVSNLILHSLTMLLLVIVYVGAIIILIGYICAVCPNLILTPTHFSSMFYFCYLSLFALFFCCQLSSIVSDVFLPMTNYFYSSYGSIVFFSLVFILFITLLIVTSQYITPNGPFRSVAI